MKLLLLSYEQEKAARRADSSCSCSRVWHEGRCHVACATTLRAIDDINTITLRAIDDINTITLRAIDINTIILRAIDDINTITLRAIDINTVTL